MADAVVYYSEKNYLASITDLALKITKIEAMIQVLMDGGLDASANNNVAEYWLDSGQTKIKTVYRGAESIMATVKMLEAMKVYYSNKINGNVFRLIDSRNLRAR